LAIRRKWTVNIWALKGVIRNGTYEKGILFVQIILRNTIFDVNLPL